jgi:hypothetical protein
MAANTWRKHNKYNNFKLYVEWPFGAKIKECYACATQRYVCEHDMYSDEEIVSKMNNDADRDYYWENYWENIKQNQEEKENE